MKLESQLSLPKGRPIKATKEDVVNFKPKKNCTNLDKYQGRKTEIVSKKFGFKCKSTYLNAKKAVLKGTPELIKLLDEKKISKYHASLLADLPFEVQLELLHRDPKERRSFLKKSKAIENISQTKASKNTTFLQVVTFLDQELKEINETYQIPQYIQAGIVIKSLTICSSNPSVEIKAFLEVSSLIDSKRFLKLLSELSLKESMEEIAHA